MNTVGDLIKSNRSQLEGILEDAELTLLEGMQLTVAAFLGMPNDDMRLAVLMKVAKIQSDDVFRDMKANVLMAVITTAANATTTFQVSVEVDGQPEPEKPKGRPSRISGFNRGIGKRMINKSRIADAARAAWLAVIESTRLRQWLLENYNQSAAGEIVDPALQALIPKWLRVVNVVEHSANVNNTEILGLNDRSASMTQIVELLERTRLDRVMRAIAEYRKSQNLASTYQVFGVNGIQTYQLPDYEDLARDINALIEELNRLFKTGLFAQNVLAMQEEYERIIYPALDDAGFVNALKGVRVPYGASPLEALQEFLPDDIRFGLQMAEYIMDAIVAIGEIDTEGPLLEQFKEVGPLAHEYGHAGKEYAQALGINNQGVMTGITGMGAKLKVRFTIGRGGVSVEVQASAAIGVGRTKVEDPNNPWAHLNYKIPQRDQAIMRTWLDIVTPRVAEDGQRRSLYTRAFYASERTPGTPDFSGSAQMFAVNWYTSLSNFGFIDEGMPALFAVLFAIYPDVGRDVQIKISNLVCNYTTD